MVVTDADEDISASHTLTEEGNVPAPLPPAQRQAQIESPPEVGKKQQKLEKQRLPEKWVLTHPFSQPVN